MTAKACSCPATIYHLGQPCKHARKYFPRPKREATTEGQDSIRPKGKWPGGDNGPVDEIMGAA
ncbi:MAG: hypothetical protein PHQ39_14080 [Methanothrix soehngenii]|nr:hypothetical protein [Methanothrix soehngenii]